jgi:transposase
MTIDSAVKATISRLYAAELWPVGTIASHLGIHRETVRRAIGLAQPGGPGTLVRTSIIDNYRVFLEEQLKQYPRLRATRLYDMIRARGYKGSVRTVRHFVQGIRPRQTTTAYLNLTPLIGEQAQVDWAHVGNIEVQGGKRALWVFVMVLSYSRAVWAELVLDLTAASLRRSLIRATSFFKGTPRQWLFDNPKIVVIERQGQSIRFHPELLDLCALYHVEPHLCGVRKPQHKGRVERCIRYLRDRFFEGRDIFDVSLGNEQLMVFLQTTAMQREHPDLPQTTIAQALTLEQASLLALPTPLPTMETCTPVRINKCAVARFDTNQYLVPSRYASKDLMISADDAVIRFLDEKNEEVAHYGRCWGRKQKRYEPMYQAELVAQRRAGRQGAGQQRLQQLVPNINTLFERWVAAGRNVGSMTSQVTHLLDIYGNNIFIEAATDMLNRDTHDPGALALLCDNLRKQQRRRVLTQEQLPDHHLDKEVLQQGLETYDVKKD